MTTELSTLYGLARTGKIKQWGARVEQNDDRTATLIVTTGYIDGKIRDIPKVIKKGKNIGKANETTPYEQAVMEAQSKWNSKRDENYELEPMDPSNYKPRLMLPQLAKNPGLGSIVYPCFIQPKLNGVCDLAESITDPIQGMIQHHHSRGGKLFETLAHLDPWLNEINAPAPTHGELYKHGWSLQKIGGYTKKLRPDQNLLEYWLYDMAHLKWPFEERIGWLETAIQRLGPESPIKFTPTAIVNNYGEAKAFHDDCVKNGFEGAMLKNKAGIYMFQYNSNDIEKMKEFESAEFEIVGGKEGEGTDEGCVVYRCITTEGKEFDARPRGTVEDRQEMLRNLPDDIGKMLTVRFAEYSDDGIPLQPVGVPVEAEAVRDYE